MNGQVIDNNGQPVIGATVVAVHEPSGSQYANVTNQAGQFRLPNMRVGGPYIVTFSFVGYESVTREDVFLDLGQTYGVDVTMRESVTELAERGSICRRTDRRQPNRGRNQRRPGRDHDLTYGGA